MITQEPVTPLADILRNYCHVNAMTAGWQQSIKKELESVKIPGYKDNFKLQLSQALKNHTLSTKQYEALTGEDFDTQEELQSRLKELWFSLYGNEPLT